MDNKDKTSFMKALWSCDTIHFNYKIWIAKQVTGNYWRVDSRIPIKLILQEAKEIDTIAELNYLLIKLNE